MSSVRMSLSRQRRWPLIVIGVLVLLAILFTFMSQFYVDLLWFREVHYSTVFWTTIRTKFLLGLVFGLIFFALLYANLLIVKRLSPPPRLLSPEEEMVERVRQNFEPHLKWLLPLGAAVIALLVGIGVTREWQTFLLWRGSAGVSFGTTDPRFGRDPAFYVFSLPWLRFVQGWLFSALVGVTFLTAIGHFLWGGIRPQAPMWADKVTPAVRAHLSVLLGLIMLVKAWGYYLGRFDLLTSQRGVVEGASYTDVHAQLPALNFLAIVAVICAILFLVNIRVRIWALPVIAVVLLAVVSVLLGTAYPAFVQRFRVAPQEFQREEPYIADNISGTRAAFGLDKIQQTSTPPNLSTTVTAADIRSNAPTITNIRLWRPSVLKDDFQSLQRFRQYYEFRDVDVDRYPIDGQTRVLMVAGREITPAGIPSGGGTWQNQHLVYTHGYGAAAAQVNTATTEGAPQFILQDVPPTGQPTSNQWSIYYGPGGPDDAKFVIVNSLTPEFQYEGASPVPYTGSGGIPMGNVFQRALFAWRFRDVNLLISGQITPQSRIMIYRDLQTRVRKAVPFLTFDSDPYLVVTNDGLKWIWDAYTTTNEYPYSAQVDLNSATDGDLTGTANYMRNSVKVEIDAYTGAITYYADMSDPIIHAWSNAFPGLFTNMDQAPSDIQAHFRYPEDLFQVQATQYANYHVTDPSVFYQKADFWAIPNDPTLSAPTTSTVTPAAGTASAVLRPYYLLMRIPGETTEHFELVLPFVPQGRQNMVAWMAANSDPGEYGKMTSFVFPTGVNIDGPDQVYSRINQDPDFSRDRTLLGTGGSQVLFGDFQVIPVGQSFLYVLPVYVRSAQTTAVPELKRVIVVDGSQVGVGADLVAALDSATHGQTGGGGNNGGGNNGGGSVDQQISALLAQALVHFQAADQALKSGDLATYQSELKLAQQLVQQANNLAAQQTGGSPSPSPSASPGPSSVPSASSSP